MNKQTKKYYDKWINVVLQERYPTKQELKEMREQEEIRKMQHMFLETLTSFNLKAKIVNKKRK